MKQAEIEDNIGKEVVVNGFRDLGFDPEMRRIIGQTCTLIKKCKSGKLEIEHKGRRYSVPPTNVDLKPTES